MKTAFWITLVIAVIGGVNWALYGITGIDLVEQLFGTYTVASRGIYVVVGAASLALVAISSAYVYVLQPETKPERATRKPRAARISRKARATKVAA